MKRFGADLRLASALQATLNDLKRDALTAARELDLPTGTIQRALAGEPADAERMRNRIVAKWPVSARRLTLLEDDVSDDILFWNAEAAQASSRVISRAGTPYYEYRDTAMARVSPIRPEWIRMLVVSEPDVLDPQVRWNKGHALHQLTYFLGDVNFFYEQESARFCRRMQVGDSALIPSFVAHTFTATTDGRDPFIVAVTFPAALNQEVIEDLVVCHAGLLNTVDKQLRIARDDFPTPLLLHLQRASLSVPTVANLAEIDVARLEQLITNAACMTIDEVQALSAALCISPSELLRDDVTCEVVKIVQASHTISHPYPESGRYGVRQLAGSAFISGARGVEITVRAIKASDQADALWSGSHQYGFVLPGSAVDMSWGEGLAQLRTVVPGDSFYLKPWVRHAFTKTGKESADPQILSFRCDGALGAAALQELLRAGPEGLDGHRSHKTQWYS